MTRPTAFPQWCLLCARQAFDNSCGHFPGPMPQHIWTAGDWYPWYVIANEIGASESVRILLEHRPYADHCLGYEVLAWPCPTAADTLAYLSEGGQR